MLTIYHLVLEVTRKCNMRCSHCMRGNPQRLTMSRDVLWHTLKDVSSISTITFTGGEPSLAPQVLEDAMDIIRDCRIELGGFDIVTNGKTRNGFQRFLKVCDRLYEWSDEKESCGLVVSRDQFHKREMPQLNLSKFMGRAEDYDGGYEFEREYFHPTDRDRPIERVINDGRAEELQLGGRDPEQQSPWLIRTWHDEDNPHVTEDVVYVAANGNVVSNCDMSFKRIDRESRGNVLEKPLKDIILSYCKKEEE